VTECVAARQDIQRSLAASKACSEPRGVRALAGVEAQTRPILELGDPVRGLFPARFGTHLVTFNPGTSHRSSDPLCLDPVDRFRPTPVRRSRPHLCFPGSRTTCGGPTSSASAARWP